MAITSQHDARWSAVAREHQPSAVHHLLQFYRHEEVFHQRPAELALGEGIGDDEPQMPAWLEQAKRTLEERCDELIILSTFEVRAVSFSIIEESSLKLVSSLLQASMIRRSM